MKTHDVIDYLLDLVIDGSVILKRISGYNIYGSEINKTGSG
jgi:hypothetical protein